MLIKDPDPLLFHAEVVYRNQRALGYIRAASYGHTLGGAVGLAMIEADCAIDQDFVDKGQWKSTSPAKISRRRIDPSAVRSRYEADQMLNICPFPQKGDDQRQR